MASFSSCLDDIISNQLSKLTNPSDKFTALYGLRSPNSSSRPPAYQPSFDLHNTFTKAFELPAEECLTHIFSLARVISLPRRTRFERDPHLILLLLPLLALVAFTLTCSCCFYPYLLLLLLPLFALVALTLICNRFSYFQSLIALIRSYP